jgi:large subunit ribosomal protein L13
MKTYVPQVEQLRHDWWILDATGLTLGRLATGVATRIRGKHKATYTPYLDTGDHVIVIHAEKVALTGRKLDGKIYRRHSGYPGGLTEIPARDMLRRHPERLIEAAVQGMLPKGPLGRRLVRKLKVYAGGDHPHAAQQPKPLTIPGASRGGE